jgi:hypothetical protein
MLHLQSDLQRHLRGTSADANARRDEENSEMCRNERHLPASAAVGACVCVCFYEQGAGDKHNPSLTCDTFQIEEFSLELMHANADVTFHNLFTLNYNLWYGVSKETFSLSVVCSR